jgi:hypothetical protein
MKRTKTILPLEKPKRIFKPSLPITEKETVKTKQISTSRKRSIVVCSDSKRCWYKGTCPHREKHVETEKCEISFCSIMNISNCKCVKPEKK